MGGGGRFLKVTRFFESLPLLAYASLLFDYLPVVSVIALQFVRNVFAFDSSSPPSVPLSSVTLEALFRDLQLLQPSVVELQSEKTL